jgi:hypothetical protein
LEKVLNSLSAFCDSSQEEWQLAESELDNFCHNNSKEIGYQQLITLAK